MPRITAPFIFLIIVFIGFCLFVFLGMDLFYSYSTASRNLENIKDLVESDMIIAVLSYICIYIVVVAFSLPVASFLTILGGFLFGPFFGTIWVVIGATTGATVIFLVARTAFAPFLHRHAGRFIPYVREGFQANAFTYLLLLRLIPAFPFFVVNILSALMDVSIRTYFITTIIGIAPASFVYASVGAGASSLLSRGNLPNLSVFLDVDILLPIIGVAVLALLPVVYKIINVEKNKKNL